jgi:hypothetical protein
MASNSLSPNVEQCDCLPSGKPQRVRKPDPHRTHRAIMTLAMFRARSAVLKDIRAQGKRPSDFSARQITELAEGYFAQHMEPLITEAVEVIATSPGFARWRCAELSSDAQLEKMRKSIISRVQNSSAKRRADQ